MTERNAMSQGLEFTGAYERFSGKEKLKLEAKKIRKEYKCRIVLVDADGGYSLYADSSYFDSRELIRLNNQIDAFDTSTQRLLEKYQAELKKMQDSQLARLAKVAEIQERL